MEATAERDRLRGELVALVAELQRVQARLVAAVAEAGRRGLWAVDGAASAAAWLAAHTGVAYHTARAWAELAEGLEDWPATSTALAEGRIGFDQARAIVRAGRPEFEAEDVAVAETSTHDELRRRLRARDEGDLRALRMAERRRFVRWSFDDRRRCFTLTAELPDDQGALVAKTLERLATTTPPDPTVGCFLGYEARLADALVELCSERLGLDRDPDRATVVVHVDAEVLSGERLGGGVVADGPALHVETLRRFLCDGRVQVVVEDEGVAVGVGRVTRTIPPWLGRILQARDGGCRFPGCGRRRWVHRHHIVPWSAGGPTDLDNLVTVCGFHHRLLHEGGWRIAGDPNREIRWLGPSGSEYRPRDLTRSLLESANVAIPRVQEFFDTS
ncbi:MAG TPA: HNH endonuclease [Actinobacteria bacterium]|nr:HNH endonuclease [Actinomycetota bacterium]